VRGAPAAGLSPQSKTNVLASTLRIVAPAAVPVAAGSAWEVAPVFPGLSASAPFGLDWAGWLGEAGADSGEAVGVDSWEATISV
jgi:hypothetical protein